MFLTSVSGKFFICGEYSVLFQGPALLGLTKKKFELHSSLPSTENAEGGMFTKIKDLHPQSPVGKYFNSLNQILKKKIENDFFSDPFLGKGGFGASTAQFILLLEKVNAENNVPLPLSEKWKKYRTQYQKLTQPERGLPPSGADLVAQVFDQPCVSYHPAETNCISLQVPSYFNEMYVFSATSKKNRKINTHEHLAALHDIPESTRQHLKILTHAALDFIQDSEKFFGYLGAFVKELIQLHLVSPEVQEEMRLFSEFPGVGFVKGCGAGLSDVFLVFTRANLDEAAFLAFAEKHQFEFIQKGIL